MTGEDKIIRTKYKKNDQIFAFYPIILYLCSMKTNKAKYTYT